jgi:hypothetical protein
MGRIESVSTVVAWDHNMLAPTSQHLCVHNAVECSKCFANEANLL